MHLDNRLAAPCMGVGVWVGARCWLVGRGRVLFVLGAINSSCTRCPALNITFGKFLVFTSFATLTAFHSDCGFPGIIVLEILFLVLQ